MKKKAAIERLNATPAVDFPQEPTREFERYASDLRNLLRENFRIASPIDFDAARTLFTWEVERTVGFTKSADVPNLRCSLELKHVVFFDPRKNLVEEFARVEAELERFVALDRRIFNVVYALGFET